MRFTMNVILKLSLIILAYLCYREFYELFQDYTLQRALYTEYGLVAVYWIQKTATVAVALLVLKYVWKRDPRGIKYSLVFLAIGLVSFGVEIALVNRNPEFALEAYIRSRAERGFPVDREKAVKSMEMMTSSLGLIAVVLYGLPMAGLYLKKRTDKGRPGGYHD